MIRIVNANRWLKRESTSLGSFVLLSLLLMAVCIVPAVAHVYGLAMLEGIDRPGNDIRSLTLTEAKPLRCRNECVSEPNCRAWTYVRPGIQGSNARCWLKDRIPDRVENSCCTSGVFNVLHKIQACREIGNVDEPGPVQCIDEGGQSFGSAGRTFPSGEPVVILARFQRLLVGERKLLLYYERWRDGEFRRFSGNRKTLKVKNRGPNWTWWFPAHFKKDGRWKVTVALEGDGWTRQQLGEVEYCVNCILE